MSKNRDKGNIIFFIGVLFFVVSLVVGFVTDVSGVLIDIFMGIGLIIEFIGLCICYKKDKNDLVEKKEEVQTLKEEKIKAKEEKHDDVVEVVKDMKQDNNKNNNKNKNNKKKNNNKKKVEDKNVNEVKENTVKKDDSVKKNNTSKKNNTNNKNHVKKNYKKGNNKKKVK
jgi:hypothetical protein